MLESAELLLLLVAILLSRTMTERSYERRAAVYYYAIELISVVAIEASSHER